MNIVGLPEDVLYEVTAYLSIADLLSMKQTCRALHAFGSSDYLWHRMSQRLGLPLDIPPGVSMNSLSHDELQSIAIKAMRLEINWGRRKPILRRVKPLLQGGNGSYVDEMLFLPGARWLLTAQRHRQMEGRWSSHLVLWSLEDLENPHEVAIVEAAGFYRSSAIEMTDGGQSATLVVGVNDGTEVIEVYFINLRGPAEFSYYAPSTPAASRKIVVPSHPQVSNLPPVIHQLALANGTIAASVVIPGGNRSLQVLLAHTVSGSSEWVDPQLLESFSILWVRLYDDYCLLLGMIRSSLMLRIYKLPSKNRLGFECIAPEVQASTDGYRFLHLGTVIAQYEQQLRRNAEFHDISRVSLPSSSSISIVIFYAFRDSSSGVGQVIQFPLPFSPQATETAGVTRNFSMPAQVSAQLAQVGPTGRAVWLEHNWDTQQRRIMRYQPRSGATLGMLLPPDPALPFTPNICHSLAFDEVTGRLCLGLFNGDVYVLDFV